MTAKKQLNSTISDQQPQELLQYCINLLTPTEQAKVTNLQQQGLITSFVDGIGLACPMPLLKTKIALRSMTIGDSVYIIATDPNSQLDLDAFCKQTGLNIVLSTQSKSTLANTTDTLTNRLENLDTIFHVIITKTHGN